MTYCGTAQVLGVPRGEAAESLAKGDTDFIRRVELPEDFSRAASLLAELNRIHPAASFYAGLLAGETGDTPELETLLYCAALESPLIPAQREAVSKLIPAVLEAETNREAGNVLDFLNAGNAKKNAELLLPLRAACFYRLGRYTEAAETLPAGNTAPESRGAGFIAEEPHAEWKTALALFAARRASPGQTASALEREITSFLFDTPALLPPAGEVLRWAAGEALSLEGLLSETERGVLDARLSPGNYGVMLNNMLPAAQDGSGVFFRHPGLIADIGRAFQYTPSMRDEGVALFKSWEGFLDAQEAGTQVTADAKNARFMILFYLGRMERARGNYAESSDYFTKAREISPDALQSDACIWYTLMNAADVSPSAAVPLVQRTVSAWNDISYFADILDRLSAYFAGRRQWNTLREIFLALERRGASAPLAQYAWIVGRAAEEGYLATDRPAEDFFRVAYNAGNASLYYRAMAASKLGVTFTPENEHAEADTTPSGAEVLAVPAKTEKDEAEFILGFFECGAAGFAWSYLADREHAFSVTDLQKIAEAFADADRWKESLDLVARYMARNDYALRERDLILFYPRPFLAQTEKYARQAETEAEILYGLIRTESYFMPDVVSHSGAVGLAQLMAPTAAEMAGRIVRQGGPDYRGEDGIDLKNPEINIHIGSFYLRYLYAQMGNPMLALLAYNGGMGRMRRWLAADRRHDDGGLPYDLFLETVEYAETREYGRRVLAAAAVYGYLYYGKTMAEVAAQIFAAIQS